MGQATTLGRSVTYRYEGTVAFPTVSVNSFMTVGTDADASTTGSKRSRIRKGDSDLSQHSHRHEQAHGTMRKGLKDLKLLIEAQSSVIEHIQCDANGR